MIKDVNIRVGIIQNINEDYREMRKMRIKRGIITRRATRYSFLENKETASQTDRHKDSLSNKQRVTKRVIQMDKESKQADIQRACPTDRQTEKEPNTEVRQTNKWISFQTY